MLFYKGLAPAIFRLSHNHEASFSRFQEILFRWLRRLARFFKVSRLEALQSNLATARRSGCVCGFQITTSNCLNGTTELRTRKSFVLREIVDNLADMPAGSIPELQQKLFKRIGISSLPPTKQRGVAAPGRHGSSRRPGRKENRKQQRAQKKSHRYSKPTVQPVDVGKERHAVSHANHRLSPIPADPISAFEDGEQEDTAVADTDLDGDLEASAEEGEEEQGSLEDDLAKDIEQTSKAKSLSKAHCEKLAQDDAEIEEFERKLGIRKGRRSLPQAFKDDGLDELIGEMDEDAVSSEDEMKKRKIVYDDWLSSKRRKTEPRPVSQRNSAHRITESLNPTRDDSESDSIESAEIEYGDSSDGSGLDSDHGGGHEHDQALATGQDDEPFDGLDSDTEAPRTLNLPKRENPYIAPMDGTAIPKYVPPSRRHESTESEKQAKSHLQKKIQGLINRLTDANLISIVQSVDEIYQSNARGEVTEVLTDSILAQMRKQESLPDQFFVLVGGFSAAIYKITGSSFGSHMVRHVVNEFSEYYDQASVSDSNQQGPKKETSNFLTFLTQLYVFEVVSCRIIFDYMGKLLNNLSELNVELLLRVCRMAGRLLRKDDPQALKHVSHVLSTAVNKIGYRNVSARTKFMIETIQDLKNSKPKAKGMDSAVVSEHVLRMKKRLGELKSQSRRLDGLAPMGIGLNDVESVDKHGKWWLVGASVPTYRDAEKRAKAVSGFLGTDPDPATEDEDMDFVLPDYPNKARAQGLNTTAQIAIFTAVMSGLNYEHGYRQYAGLKLKRDEQLEITRVLVQCVGSEPQYNEYYALVASQACVNGRIRFSFQDRLWKIFRSLGESLFGEGADNDETMEGDRMKNEHRLGNIARFYASLVIDSALSINLLKPLDLPEMNSWCSYFVEWLLLSLLRECRGKGSNEDMKVERVFSPATELPALAANLHWFLRKKIRKSRHVGDKERKAIERVREKAQTAVHGAKGSK